MAKLVYGLNQSLDGYVDHLKLGPPRPALFRYFIEQVRGLTGMLYGRRIYEIMRYWDDDLLVLRTPRPLPRLRCPKSNQGECEFR